MRFAVATACGIGIPSKKVHTPKRPSIDMRPSVRASSVAESSAPAKRGGGRMRASGWRRGRRLATLAFVWLATASHADVNVTVPANASLYRAGGNAPELAGANPRRVDLAPG